MDSEKTFLPTLVPKKRAAAAALCEGYSRRQKIRREISFFEVGEADTADVATAAAEEKVILSEVKAEEQKKSF